MSGEDLVSHSSRRWYGWLSLLLFEVCRVSLRSTLSSAFPWLVSERTENRIANSRNDANNWNVYFCIHILMFCCSQSNHTLVFTILCTCFKPFGHHLISGKHGVGSHWVADSNCEHVLVGHNILTFENLLRSFYFELRFFISNRLYNMHAVSCRNRIR